MKALGRNWLARCVALIMSCSLPSRTWKLSGESFDPTFTPKAPITLRRLCRNALLLRGSASVWLSWVIPRVTRLGNCWNPLARGRMPERGFLVVRLGSLGDIVQTFPAVAGLRQSFPEAEIVWLTHPRWKSLVESSGLATDIWEMETRSYDSLRRTIRQTRKKRFSAAIDYQGLWKSAALPFFGGVPRRIGVSSQSLREFGVPILYTYRYRCATTQSPEQQAKLSP